MSVSAAFVLSGHYDKDKALYRQPRNEQIFIGREGMLGDEQHKSAIGEGNDNSMGSQLRSTFPQAPFADHPWLWAGLE